MIILCIFTVTSIGASLKALKLLLINNNYFQEHTEKYSICYSVRLWLYLKQQYNKSKTSSTAVLPPLCKGKIYPANIWPPYIFVPHMRTQILRARVDLVAHLNQMQMVL